MKCPYCGHSEDRVLDTREQKEGETIRRRRECLNCRSRFSTVETLSLAFPFVVKKDGRREPYSKEKVLKGLQAACQKRPISLAQLEAVVERISNWTMARGEKEISASMVGQKIMRELRILDDVAYVRFASVYRNFQDVQEFVETLEENDGVEVFESGAQLSLTPDIRSAEGKNSEPARSQTEETVPRTCPADSLSN
ncbi:MAG: transcriptional regulator NrdR [Bdellovibrio sp.]|jgi:transcriptional repressor NrdR